MVRDILTEAGSLLVDPVLVDRPGFRILNGPLGFQGLGEAGKRKVSDPQIQPTDRFRDPSQGPLRSRCQRRSDCEREGRIERGAFYFFIR